MKDHNKISFIREYCRCRRIPYKIDRETLYIDKHYFCFSVYNLTYLELVQAIDKACIYDDITTYFVSYIGCLNKISLHQISYADDIGTVNVSRETSNHRWEVVL